VLSLLVAVKTRDKLKAAVCNGKRPDLSVIAGPDELLTLTLDCISRCWHQNPNRRPAFKGAKKPFIY